MLHECGHFISSNDLTSHDKCAKESGHYCQVLLETMVDSEPGAIDYEFAALPVASFSSRDRFDLGNTMEFPGSTGR
jgi:hypothetical protein